MKKWALQSSVVCRPAHFVDENRSAELINMRPLTEEMDRWPFQTLF